MPVIVHILFPLILLRSRNKAYYHPNIIDPFFSILYFTVAVYLDLFQLVGVGREVKRRPKF